MIILQNAFYNDKYVTNLSIVLTNTMRMNWSVVFFMAARYSQPNCTKTKVAVAAEITHVVRRVFLKDVSDVTVAGKIENSAIAKLEVNNKNIQSEKITFS